MLSENRFDYNMDIFVDNLREDMMCSFVKLYESEIVQNLDKDKVKTINVDILNYILYIMESPLDILSIEWSMNPEYRDYYIMNGSMRNFSSTDLDIVNISYIEETDLLMDCYFKVFKAIPPKYHKILNVVFDVRSETEMISFISLMCKDVGGLTFIRNLSKQTNAIIDLIEMKYIRYLYLRDVHIANLNKCKFLRNISLIDCDVESIHGLQYLEILECCGRKLTHVYDLPRLKIAQLTFVGVQKDNMYNLPLLEELTLNYSSSLDSLPELPSLKILTLDTMYLDNLSDYVNLEHLKLIYFQDTMINVYLNNIVFDIRPLVNLKTLTMTVELFNSNIVKMNQPNNYQLTIIS